MLEKADLSLDFDHFVTNPTFLNHWLHNNENNVIKGNNKAKFNTVRQ